MTRVATGIGLPTRAANGTIFRRISVLRDLCWFVLVWRTGCDTFQESRLVFHWTMWRGQRVSRSVRGMAHPVTSLEVVDSGSQAMDILCTRPSIRLLGTVVHIIPAHRVHRHRDDSQSTTHGRLLCLTVHNFPQGSSTMTRLRLMQAGTTQWSSHRLILRYMASNIQLTLVPIRGTLNLSASGKK